MFYSHTQARSKMPKKRRGVLSVDQVKQQPMHAATNTLLPPKLRGIPKKIDGVSEPLLARPKVPKL